MSKSIEDIHVDAEEKDLKRAEKLTRKKKKLYNYMITFPSICFTCIHSSRDTIEDDLECDLLYDERWAVGMVDLLGICVKYESRKNRG